MRVESENAHAHGGGGGVDFVAYYKIFIKVEYVKQLLTNTRIKFHLER